MPADRPRRVLILGGTAEATALARRLAAERPSLPLVLSLAGRTLAPDLPAGIDARIGGFGGAAGLAAFLGSQAITHLVDATHPFAAGISRNAAEAAATAGVRRLALHRPGWTAGPDDRWLRVACLAGARDALPHGARPFLALGRQHLATFRHRPDLRPVLRMVDPPDDLPFAADLVLGKPGDRAAEVALMARTGVTHLVCRDSGGRASFAKVEAARALGLPVVLIDRPPPPPPPLAADTEAALAWLAG
ncbi:cobalt-precorrin-6A reductase [Aureimonas flava]|uniref:Cobalt-precorrin-6A reductase n=1 Tax=Aureimonas flava TaxID=2320271 RepID=A0A3A1WJ70_9HYPH|nr:cobalt-precorrin-6A reductase [Aureimonas flava]RIX99074.1 cobalt-precorrin-6A reductase [Aureimonas flava]